MDIPVYLFLGFLESGKTQFIQGTLEDKRFGVKEKTLLLVCEEGVEEYHPENFVCKNVFIETIEDVSELTPELFKSFEKKYNVQRAMVELNGVWSAADLYNALPENWIVCQKMFFADANTILTYNANIRSLVVDKLQNCDLVAFNRLKKDDDTMPLHKLVRGITRSTDIIYESEDGSIQYDEIEDPLPFDIEAPVVEIKDIDYALFYRDIMEEPKKYNGKTVKFKGIVALNSKIPPETFIIGRHIMTCCVQDIAFRGLICSGKVPDGLKNRDWIILTAKVDYEHHKLYRGKGPVLKIISSENSEVPEQEVATFY